MGNGSENQPISGSENQAMSGNENQAMSANKPPVKICKKCKEEINKKAKKCPKCGANQGFPVWAIILIVFVLICILGSDGDTDTESLNSESSGSSSSAETNTSSSNSSNSSTSNTKSKYGLGETFTFDGLELTLDTSYSFVTIENRFSEKNGSSVIKIGVTIKNVSSETTSLNMFYYDFFGSQGTELDGVASYFDESVDYAGDLRPEASYVKYFYILYDGDGTYGIDFDNFTQKVQVEFDVTK